MSARFKVLTGAAALTVCSSAAFALPQVPDENGFSGYVAVGAGWTDVESNTVSGNKVIDLDNDPIDNIIDSPDGRDTAFPAVLGEVKWTFGDRQQLFAGTSVENAVTQDGGVEFGWRRTSDNLGTYQFGGLVNRLVPLEVYQDPFETNTRRRDTDWLATGIRFQWDKILGSQFEWQLTARDIDVDKERSGQSLIGTTVPSGNTFTAADAELLERDGDEISTRISYLLDFDDGHSFRPLLGYKDFDADGDAQDFESFRMQLSYAYQGDRFSLIANTSWSQRDYDTDNPVYGIERDEDITAVDATVIYRLDIWDGNWAAFGNALWGEVDSDIDFYDTQVVSVSAGLQYRF